MLIIFLSILLTICYYYMGFFAYFTRKEGPTNKVFLGLTILFSAWCLSGALYNLQNVPDISALWMLISYLIWTVGTGLILHFCLLLNRNHIQMTIKQLLVIYTPAAIMLAGMILFNGLVPSNAITLTPLKVIFGIPGGIAFYVIYIAISIAYLLRMGRMSSEFRVKQQSRLISSSLAVASILIGIYGFILPPIVNTPMPVLLPFFPIIWITTMWLSITKYGFLSVTMEFATREILDNIQEIIILADHKSVILDVNKKFEEVAQISKSEINGKRIHDVLAKNPAVIERIQQVLSNELEEYAGDLEFYIDSESSLPLRIRISTIVDHLDQIIGVILAANDLTLEKKFEIMAITDGLTNAYNRTKMERIMERLMINQTPFSVIMFDMDFFKKINDEFGHSTGDHVLVSAVNIVNRELRALDFIGRWGGEEFLVVVQEADELEALQIAERIRLAIAHHDFGILRPVTVSLGVSITSVDAASIVDLVNQADVALYEAKHTGRNRTVLYSQLIQKNKNHKPV